MSDQALEYLRDKSEQSRDVIGAELAKSRVTEQEILQQVQMLKEYRKEYREKMQQTMLRGTPLQSMQDYRTFLASLDLSIESANNYLANQRQCIALCLQKLQTHQRELNSFGALVERRKTSRVAALARQERKEQDVLASQVHRRNLSSSTYSTAD